MNLTILSQLDASVVLALGALAASALLSAGALALAIVRRRAS
jgi:hypothetical protein